ncbi:MAG: hypothetical protein QW562_07100, partial [Thermosphaera sp.]
MVGDHGEPQGRGTTRPRKTYKNLERETVENHLVLSNQIVLQKLQEALENMGYRTLLLTSMLEGEAREVGRVLA